MRRNMRPPPREEGRIKSKATSIAQIHEKHHTLINILSKVSKATVHHRPRTWVLVSCFCCHSENVKNVNKSRLLTKLYSTQTKYELESEIHSQSLSSSGKTQRRKESVIVHTLTLTDSAEYTRFRQFKTCSPFNFSA